MNAFRIIVVILASLVLITLLFIIVRGVMADKAFREDMRRSKPRMDDAEYLGNMPFLDNGRDRALALQFRAAFADVARLPRECVSPEMTIADLFRAQAFIVSDGIDQAELVMALEDQLDVEIPEDSSGIPVTDGDTVGTFTKTLLEYGRVHWPMA